MRLFVYFLVFVIMPFHVMAREAIHVVGSSTVFPFVAAAAEQFGRRGEFRTPIVEATGTGGGLKMFCSGDSLSTPDMANASRPIKSAEIGDCKKNGVQNIVELKLGYDGIVFVTSIKGGNFSLTRLSIFKALAKEVPRGGKLIANPYHNWRDIDAALPDLPIRVYGPPPTSGTRDAFAELVMLESCKALPEYMAKYSDEEIRKLSCQQIREDGAYIEAGENDNLLVQKLSNDSEALAVFGYSFLEQNAAVVKAHPVDGVLPSFDAIIKGDYKVARSLFTYIKKDHVDNIQGLREFALELTSDAAVGDNGYLIMKGLLPLPKAEHQIIKLTAQNLTVMK